MQVYAFDSTGKKVFITRAHSGLDYFCPECKGRMRLRRTMKRKIHFFHLSSKKNCRLAGKSIFHIATQNFIQKSIGIHDCDQEVPFETIGRIADIAWYSKKIVIEIQCSFITAREVEERCKAYESAGWEVVWILHEKTFNPAIPTEAELFLRNRTHYYTNIDEEQGHIYDQCLPASLAHFPIDISTLEQRTVVEKSFPRLVQHRLLHWRYSASGDIVWHALQGSTPLLDELFRFDKRGDIPLTRKVKRLYCSIFGVIRSLWYLVVEGACRR